MNISCSVLRIFAGGFAAMMRCAMHTCLLVVAAMAAGAAAADDDLIWQNKNGQVHYWLLKNGKRLDGINIGASGPVGRDWVLSGVGDMNGDGMDDILWQHRNGQAHYWPIMNGRRLDGLNIGAPSGMDLIGAGDLDGDGTDDLVWADDGHKNIKFWPMRDAKPSGEIKITNLAVGWVVAIGDMNGDRTDDLIVGDLVDGKWQLTVCLLRGGRRVDSFEVLANVAPDAYWSVRGAGDLDGDGFDEIVWKKRNGQVRYWVVRDGAVKFEADIGAAGPVDNGEWRLAGVGNVDNGFSPQPAAQQVSSQPDKPSIATQDPGDRFKQGPGGIAPQISAPEDNTNRPGSDYERYLMDDAHPCRAACVGDSRCEAWTFVRAGIQGPTGVCYLKRPAPPPVPNACCVSGTVTR